MELIGLMNGERRKGKRTVKGKIVSLSEWRRIQRRVERMDLRELAITVHRLIGVMSDLVSHIEELEEKIKKN